MVDVAAGSIAVAVHRFEAVAGGVLEKTRVVVVGIVRTRARRSVIDQAGVDTRLPEAVDVGLRLRDERNVGAPGRRTVIVVLHEDEVPPHGEARRVGGLLDPEFSQPGTEGTDREREVRDAKADMVKHGRLLGDGSRGRDRRALEPRRHHAYLDRSASAVDGDRRAGDVARARGREERDDLGDLLRLRRATHRRRLPSAVMNSAPDGVGVYTGPGRSR